MAANRLSSQQHASFFARMSPETKRLLHGGRSSVGERIEQLVQRNRECQLVAALQRLALGKLLHPRLGRGCEIAGADGTIALSTLERVPASQLQNDLASFSSGGEVLRGALIEGDREDGLGQLLEGCDALGARLQRPPLALIVPAAARFLGKAVAVEAELQPAELRL